MYHPRLTVPSIILCDAVVYSPCQWLSTRLQYLQCISTGDTAVLHWVIDTYMYHVFQHKNNERLPTAQPRARSIECLLAVYFLAHIILVAIRLDETPWYVGRRYITSLHYKAPRHHDCTQYSPSLLVKFWIWYLTIGAKQFTDIHEL